VQGIPLFPEPDENFLGEILYQSVIFYEPSNGCTYRQIALIKQLLKSGLIIIP
jgi:hypothetical protein